jgi:hypothetical protein
VSVRPAGSPPDTPPSLSERLDLTSGAAATVTLSGPFADLRLAVVPDDLSAPPAGAAHVRVLGASADGRPVGATVHTGPRGTETLRLPESGSTGPGAYVAVPAGPARVVVPGSSGQVPVDLAAGSVVSLLVLDTRDGGRLVRPVVDAVGPATVPRGAVDAGTGPAGVPLPTVLGSLVLLGPLGLAAARRGRVPLLLPCRSPRTSRRRRRHRPACASGPAASTPRSGRSPWTPPAPCPRRTTPPQRAGSRAAHRRVPGAPPSSPGTSTGPAAPAPSPDWAPWRRATR